MRTSLPRKHRPGKILASAQGVDNLPHRIALEEWWSDTPEGGFDIENVLHMTLQKMPWEGPRYCSTSVGGRVPWQSSN